MRITEIKPEYVDNVPALSGMKEGVLYINKNDKWTLHLCPEPEINTFEDLKEAGKMANMFASTTVWKNPEDEREVDFTAECGDSPAERKALATLKIAQLIDVAYGGIVTADEHQYDEAWVYAITYDHNSKHYPFEIILAEKSHDLLSFHSADYDNAERFLCYNEDLVRDFYMMPRKEDENDNRETTGAH